MHAQARKKAINQRRTLPKTLSSSASFPISDQKAAKPHRAKTADEIIAPVVAQAHNSNTDCCIKGTCGPIIVAVGSPSVSRIWPWAWRRRGRAGPGRRVVAPTTAATSPKADVAVKITHHRHDILRHFVHPSCCGSGLLPWPRCCLPGFPARRLNRVGEAEPFPHPLPHSDVLREPCLA